MANLTHKKTTTEKVTIKGIMNDEATMVDCDGEMVVIQEYLDKFASGYIEIAFVTKEEEDLMDCE